MQTRDVTLREITFMGWPSWLIQCGPLELVCVPQVGGRVMRLAWRNIELCFTHPEFRGRIEPVEQVSDVRAAKREMGFRLWGGEKTWLAPQTRWTDDVPFLDLDSGHYTCKLLSYTPEQVSLQMTSPVCRETGVQLIRTLTVQGPEPFIDITHTLVNAATTPVEWGLWSVSQFLKPAHVYVPRRPDSPFPDGVKTFIEEGQSATVRAQVVREIGGLAQIECEDDIAFKFGVDASEGWLLGVCGQPGAELVGYLTTYPVFMDQPYGHDCTAEVFNSDRLPYFEAEVHSPLLRLEPGEQTEFRETRRMFSLEALPTTEEAIRYLISYHRAKPLGYGGRASGVYGNDL